MAMPRIFVLEDLIIFNDVVYRQYPQCRCRLPSGGIGSMSVALGPYACGEMLFISLTPSGNTALLQAQNGIPCHHLALSSYVSPPISYFSA